MNIPQVNATVTDRNREQTKRICELKGIEYCAFKENAGRVYARWSDFVTGDAGPPSREVIVEDLPSGSFTLCQVVGMLKEQGWVYRPNEDYWPSGDYYGDDLQGFFKMKELNSDADAFKVNEPVHHHDGDIILAKDEHPHDLTAAMDALIAIEEKKKNA